jgi:hypothetical protein
MNNHEEADKVLEVVRNYQDATFKGDAARLRGLFHEKAVMNGYLGPDLLIGGPEPFFQDMASAPSMEAAGDPYKGLVESIRVEGGAASVVFSETGFRGSASIVDFFQLIRVGGEWKIIAKLFATV